MKRLIILCLFMLLAFGFFFFRYATEEDRALALRILRGIKSVLYEGASIHNPEGDVVPDELDNALIKRLKRERCLAKGESPC